MTFKTTLNIIKAAAPYQAKFYKSFFFFGTCSPRQCLPRNIICLTVSGLNILIYNLKNNSLQLSMEPETSKCAFWKYRVETLQGEWSTEGCEVDYANVSHTSCKCNHLTHFAILMTSSSHNQVSVRGSTIRAEMLTFYILSIFLAKWNYKNV